MMATDTKKIDDAVLALLHLTLHDQSHASAGFAPEVLGRLRENGMIEDPAEDSDSIEFTPEGLQRSKALFATMFTAPSAEAQTSASPTKYPEHQRQAFGSRRRDVADPAARELRHERCRNR